ncbi:hypothetical protein GC722_16915 [Auraticoccus sp. F435]|uniref:Uncharacterized protein n=1 Tax=Auraticoccus cholistanensis TaxID=2656650 RepID=A0A6A9V283_9ACTN|nr:hypothetical protein [Auraticoccus cholistanensis]MVA77684.1 hypothetical protein [Auraticoccus cholistanensis]
MTLTSDPARAGRTPAPLVAPGGVDRPSPAARDVPAAGRAAPPAGGRTMAGYLLVPRPGDAFKALLIPCAFLLGVLGAGGTDPRTVLRAAVVLLAVELLIYPARYQWNDVRGFAADQRHPSAKDRGRLPGPLERGREHILASCAVAAARLALVAGLVLALPQLHLGPLLALAAVAVFGVAAVYEWLRSAGTGRSEQVPAPLRPAVVAIWLAVGAGYAVRGLIGLGLALGLADRPVLAVAATVALWAYGIGFVTSRWAVEATAFCVLRGGEPVWTVQAQHAREHLTALVRWLPARAEHVADGTPGADWAPLRGRTSPLAPWNLAFVVAGGAAALTGWEFSPPGAAWPPAAAVAVGGALLTLAVVVAPPRARRVVTGAGALLLLVGVVLLGSATPSAASVVAVLPWLVVMLAYVTATRNSLSTMGSWARPLTRPVGAALGALARWVVGSSAWELVHPPAPVAGDAPDAGPRGPR